MQELRIAEGGPPEAKSKRVPDKRVLFFMGAGFLALLLLVSALLLPGKVGLRSGVLKAKGVAPVVSSHAGEGRPTRLLFGDGDDRPIPDRVDLPVKPLRQTDPAWAYVSLGSSTIGAEGCALTCLAMYDSLYGDGSSTPVSLGEELGQDAYPLEWEAYATLRGLDLCQKDDTVLLPVRLESRLYVEHTVLRHLAAGRPVIIGLYTRSTGGTHFVLAHGYEYDSGNYHIQIYDPAEGSDYCSFDEIGPERGFCRLVVFK